MTVPARAPRPVTGRFVLIALLAFFAVIIGVNIVMIWFAVATLSGTEVDSAYSASLAYQGEIRAAQQQDSRNWKVDAHVERRPDGTAVLNIRARDPKDALLAGLAVSARLERPTDRREDRLLDVTESGGGSYRGKAEDVAAGQWDLVIEADRGDQRLFLSRNRVVLN